MFIPSVRRTEQLMRLIVKLETKRKLCHRRVQIIDDNRREMFEEGKEVPLNYYESMGFDRDDEIAEAMQAGRSIRRAGRLLGIEIIDC